MKVMIAGAPVEAVFDRASHPVAVPAVEGPSEVGALVQAWHAATTTDERALVVLPTWGAPRLRETYDALRMVVGHHRIVPVTTSVPPLGLSVLGAALAGAGDRYDDPNMLALLVPWLERRITVLAWTNSVTNLAHVEVPMALHARSYLSRRGFVVWAHPAPSVAPVEADAALPLALPRHPVAILADRDGPDDWRQETLAPALVGADLRVIEPPAASARYWGAKRFVEVAVVPGDLDAVLQEARAHLRLATCPWCGGAADDTHCPSCLPDGRTSGRGEVAATAKESAP